MGYWFVLLHMKIQFPSLFDEGIVLFIRDWFQLICNNICWFYMLRLFSEISNLFCWSTRHCFVFISDCFDCIFLKCLLKSGSVITSGLFLVFKIVSDIRGLLCFHMNFIIDFFFLDQWRMSWIFWLGFHWFCKQLWVAWILIY